MKSKLKYIIPILIILLFTFAVNGFAVTEAEVQAAVDGSGKESVSGNLFIWFLCAIAFMKVSQKIDTFMSSLGISVGRTGGSMLAEAMIATRVIDGSMRLASGALGKGFGAKTHNGNNPAGRGGLMGGIGKHVTGGAISSVTGSSSGGGIMNSIGKRAYENSISKGGSFATSVISSVARGEISRMGTISGANAKAAIESYFGYNAKMSKDSSSTLKHGGESTILSQNDTTTRMGIDISGGMSGASISSEGGMGDAAVYSGGENTMPTFADIEMGGGRITGYEITPDSMRPKEFAMYDAEKYAKPEGAFETVTAVDNSKWYKQYAMPVVEKTPYLHTDGKVQYNEKIVSKMPKAPQRKDRM